MAKYVATTPDTTKDLREELMRKIRMGELEMVYANESAPSPDALDQRVKFYVTLCYPIKNAGSPPHTQPET